MNTKQKVVQGQRRTHRTPRAHGVKKNKQIFKQYPKPSAKQEAQHLNRLLAGVLATAGQKAQHQGSAPQSGVTHLRPQSWIQELKHPPGPWGIIRKSGWKHKRGLGPVGQRQPCSSHTATAALGFLFLSTLPLNKLEM